ncbi:MAG: biopolymer transporter ExbD [Candidatus Firestonebacteria bacterium]|nr:biopolymer transporter ExbD [Candidatus Firestonebacteria bacterium]
MSKKKANDLKTIAEINVTPLVDVSLVLVIIFMVTVPMLLKPMEQVMLPQAVTALEERKDVVFITITTDARVVLDRKTIALDDLSGEVKSRLALSSEKVVIIRADQSVRYAVLKKVVTTTKDAGAKKIVFATDLKKKR